MYRNFICYRGGSSAGIQIANEIYTTMNQRKEEVGTTYYSPEKSFVSEMRNFLLDPGKYLGNVENFIMLLTKDFFEGFFVGDIPNPNSVTRIEIDEVLKNENVKFIPVVFPDFAWEAKTNGRINPEIIAELWGDEAMAKIVGSPPIPYVFQYKNQVIELIVSELLVQNKSKKIVVFDFDGTLTKPRIDSNTWELMWTILGYDVSECEKYHKQFSNDEISHDEWCEITEKMFIQAGCNKQHIKEAARGAELVDDVGDVIMELKSKGIMLYIVSGSIKQYVECVLGRELAGCFSEIKANRFTFDDQGMLDGIIGTPYDFEGKARFVNKIIQATGVSPKDILYVGNSFNDEFIYTTGVETLCINPKNTDFYNNKIWHNYIRRLKSLREILPYVYK